MQKPFVSIVVPTYGRPRHVRECLEAISRQTVEATVFEVVVVDDGSPEPVLAENQGDLRDVVVRVVRQENAGPAAARNRGARESRGELIAFVDDDCRPTPGWLAALVAAHRAQPEALVGGATFNGLEDETFAATSQMILDMVYEHFNRTETSAYFFASNNILCRREAYLEVGGFDVDFPRAGAEDRDFCDRWRISGRPLLWATEAKVEHRHSQTLRSFTNLHYRYGRGAFLYQAKRRRRGSGTMREDMGFHRSLWRLLPRHLGRYHGLGRRMRMFGAVVLWQAANLVGFVTEAAAGPWRSSRRALSPCRSQTRTR